MKINTKKQLNYLKKLTDKVGLIEHCNGSNPNYDEGWCVDDNARALQICVRYGTKYLKREKIVYRSLIKSAWIKGKLFNDLNRDMTWNENFSNDGEHVGRAIFALGELINEKNLSETRKMFDNIYFPVKIGGTNFLRVMAQIVLGLQYYRGEDISIWADKIIEKYEKEKTKNWHWFEKEMSYDNGRIPMALLIAYKKTQTNKYLKIAIESLDFLIKETFDENKKCFSFPGNKGWFTKNGKRPKFDQQPIEAGSMVEACSIAYKITGEEKYKVMAQKAFEWYLGGNIKNEKMIDEKSGGIYNGLNEKIVNKNQGAEAVLSYLIAAKEIERIDR